MREALTILGFGPCHHMFEVNANAEQRQLWRALALGAAPNWDQLLADYSSCVDWPSAFYWRELMAHFPQAKVVLTYRSPDLWWESFEKTIWRTSTDNRTRSRWSPHWSPSRSSTTGRTTAALPYRATKPTLGTSRRAFPRKAAGAQSRRWLGVVMRAFGRAEAKRTLSKSKQRGSDHGGIHVELKLAAARPNGDRAQCRSWRRRKCKRSALRRARRRSV